MARCTVCEKGAHFGNHVSHSNRKTRRKWKPNVKSIKAKFAGGARKINVCTSCMKSGRIERA